MEEQDIKNSTLTISLKADSGYRSKTEARISQKQYEDICLVIEGKSIISGMWGCYSCGKLLEIYSTKEGADEASTGWHAPCTIDVREVKVGDGGA